jgi:hypothetical protein
MIDLEYRFACYRLLGTEGHLVPRKVLAAAGRCLVQSLDEGLCLIGVPPGRPRWIAGCHTLGCGLETFPRLSRQRAELDGLERSSHRATDRWRRLQRLSLSMILLFDEPPFPFFEA